MAKEKITADQINQQIYRELSDKFIAALEQGEIPWKKPWICSESGYIGSSGKPYKFLNTILCAMNGHAPGEFVTAKELEKRGGHFIPTADGSKQEPTIVVIRKYPEKWVDKKDKDGNVVKDKDGKVIKERKICSNRYFLKTFKVWRVGTQVECPTKYEEKYAKKNHNPIAEAEKLSLEYIAREGIKFSHDNHNRAFYRPSADLVNVPPMDTFHSQAGYYGTLFHELAHSTGAENRLKRDIKNVFGDHLYSKEELVAEITSACIMNDKGWITAETDKNNIAYLQNWAKSLKSDPQLIENAMHEAKKAVELIYNGKKK